MCGADIDLGELRESVRQVLDRREGVLDRIPGEEGAPFDRALWRAMAELGWLGLGVDPAYGGLGCGVAHLAVLYEELGRVLASAPAAPSLIAAQLIEAHAPPALRQQLLPKLAAGEIVASLALDGAPLALREGRASGVVEDVAFAADADLLLAPTQAGGAPALLLAPMQAPGSVVADTPMVDLTRRLGRVVLDGVAAQAVLELTPADWERVRDHAALALACDSIGGARAVFERTVAYLLVREQFGRPIGSFQALKHRAANWKVQIEAASALVRHAASALGAGEPGASALASSAKFYACDLYAAVSGDAVQLHGGIGFTWEHACHLFLKRAKLNQQLCGGSAEHKDRVARLAFGELDAPPHQS